MPCKPAQIIAVVSVLTLASCSKSEPEAVFEPPPDEEAVSAAESSPAPAAQEAGGSDPTIVDPDRYTTEFENDAVRIVRIK